MRLLESRQLELSVGRRSMCTALPETPISTPLHFIAFRGNRPFRSANAGAILTITSNFAIAVAFLNPQSNLETLCAIVFQGDAKPH